MDVVNADIAGANICLTMTARDGGNANEIVWNNLCLPVGKASAPRQLLLRCPTTVHPWTYAHAPYLHPCKQKKARIKIRAEDYHQKGGWRKYEKSLHCIK